MAARSNTSRNRTNPCGRDAPAHPASPRVRRARFRRPSPRHGSARSLRSARRARRPSSQYAGPVQPLAQSALPECRRVTNATPVGLAVGLGAAVATRTGVEGCATASASSQPAASVPNAVRNATPIFIANCCLFIRPVLSLVSFDGVRRREGTVGRGYFSLRTTRIGRRLALAAGLCTVDGLTMLRGN